MSAPLKPMLATDGKKQPFPSGPGWVIEPKLDGWRWITHVEEDGFVSSYSGRNGSDRTGQAENIERVLEGLPEGTILDGELIVLDQQSPAVSTVLAHPHRGILHYVVFDVLAVMGREVTHQPWHSRRAILETLASKFDGIEVTISDPVEPSLEQHELWLREGFEGTVSKRVDSRYEPGRRSRSWYKFKPQTTADAVIIGFEEGEGSWAGGYGTFKVRLESGAETSCAIPTRAYRIDVTENPGKYLGKTVELHHHGEIGSDGLIRHPVFSRMRPDLDESKAVA